MDWLFSVEHCSTIDTRLSPARDTAEGGPGVPVDWLSSKEHCSTIDTRLSPARDTAEGGPGVLVDWLSSEEHCSTIDGRLSPARDAAEGRPGVPLDALTFDFQGKFPIDLRVVGAKMEGGFRAREVYVREGSRSKVHVH